MNAIFKTSSRLALGFLWVALALSPLSAQAEVQRAAVFPFELYDTSLQGEKGGPGADEHERLALIDTKLRNMLASSGRYDPVPLGPAAAKAAGLDLRTCDGCEVPLARELGAGVSVVGWVQKVSPLILNINLVFRDVATGKVIDGGSVDIRGDTDESWARGVAYLLHDRLHIAPNVDKADRGAGQ